MSYIEESNVSNIDSNLPLISLPKTHSDDVFLKPDIMYDEIKIECINQKINRIDTIAGYTNLEVVKLNDNNIKYVESLAPLGKLTKLKDLDLSGNPVCVLPFWNITIFKLCPSLEILNNMKKEAHIPQGKDMDDMFFHLKQEEILINFIAHIAVSKRIVNTTDIPSSNTFPSFFRNCFTDESLTDFFTNIRLGSKSENPEEYIAYLVKTANNYIKEFIDAAEKKKMNHESLMEIRNIDINSKLNSEAIIPFYVNALMTIKKSIIDQNAKGSIIVDSELTDITFHDTNDSISIDFPIFDDIIHSDIRTDILTITEENSNDSSLNITKSASSKVSKMKDTPKEESSKKIKQKEMSNILEQSINAFNMEDTYNSSITEYNDNFSIEKTPYESIPKILTSESVENVISFEEPSATPNKFVRFKQLANQSKNDGGSASVMSNSSISTIGDSPRKAISTGGLTIQAQFGNHVKTEERLHLLQEKIIEMSSEIEKVKIRIKQLSESNVERENKLKNDMKTFQNEYELEMTKLHRDTLSVLDTKNQLSKNLSELRDKVNKVSQEVFQAKAKVDQLQMEEKDTCRDYDFTVYHKSDLNSATVDTIIRNMKIDIGKVSSEKVKIVNQILEQQNQVNLLSNEIKDIQSKREETRKIVQEYDQRKIEINKEFEANNIVEEAELDLKIKDYQSVDNKLAELKKQQIEISSRMSEMTARYLALDVKQQTILNAIQISKQIPNKPDFDIYKDEEIKKITDHYKSKIRDYKAKLIKRRNEIIQHLEIIKSNKIDTKENIEKTKEDINQMNLQEQTLEKKIRSVESKIYDLLKGINEEEEEDLIEEDIDEMNINEIIIDGAASIRAKTQVYAMSQIRREQKIRDKIKKYLLANKLLEKKIENQEKENGRKVVQTRSTQLRQILAVDKETKRKEWYRKNKKPIIDLSPLKSYVSDIKDKLNDIDVILSKKRIDVNLKRKSLFQLTSNLVEYKGRKMDFFDIITEFLTRIQLEYTKWMTLRHGETPDLLKNWFNIVK